MNWIIRNIKIILIIAIVAIATLYLYESATKTIPDQIKNIMNPK